MKSNSYSFYLHPVVSLSIKVKAYTEKKGCTIGCGSGFQKSSAGNSSISALWWNG